ncbi:hypothetical protein [Azotobacter salinestris]|uniref:hypothetical protein n=1 Tax=Azotobacter salinestris TaxID=69964 RepID=UPI0032DEA3F0
MAPAHVRIDWSAFERADLPASCSARFRIAAPILTSAIASLLSLAEAALFAIRRMQQKYANPAASPDLQPVLLLYFYKSEIICAHQAEVMP